MTHSHHQSVLADVGGRRAGQDCFQESTEHVPCGLRRHGKERNLVFLPSFLDNGDDFSGGSDVFLPRLGG